MHLPSDNRKLCKTGCPIVTIVTALLAIVLTFPHRQNARKIGFSGAINTSNCCLTRAQNFPS